MIVRLGLTHVLFSALTFAQQATDPTAPTVGVDEVRTRLRDILDGARDQSGFPGAVLAVALPDGTTIAVASGCDDLEGERPLAEDARFLAGSTGKTFYAALALDLVREEKLELDATLDRYLGKTPWFARLRGGEAMTVKMLMNHTSGLERYELDPRFLERFRADPFHAWSIAERVEFQLDRDLPFAPGEGWTYSDTNYIVLGAILETLLEADLEAEIEKRFLAPLKLEGVVAARSPRIDRLACGHAGERDAFLGTDETLDDKRVLRFDPSFEWAGGGYATTAVDLARWCRALHGGDVLPRELRDAMQTGVPCPLAKGARYGLGAIHWKTRHGDAFGHSGFFPGYVSEMRYYPDLGVAAAIQVNTSDASKLRPLGAILDDAVDVD